MRYKAYITCTLLLALSTLMPTPVVAQSRERYEVDLTKHITMHQEYPKEAKAYGIEGDAIIRIRVAKNGQIVGYSLTKSPGNKALENAIRDMVKKANPAPKPPADMLKDRNAVEFMLPIAFRLKNDPETLMPIDRLFQKQVREAWKNSLPDEHVQMSIGEN